MRLRQTPDCDDLWFASLPVTGSVVELAEALTCGTGLEILSLLAPRGLRTATVAIDADGYGQLAVRATGWLGCRRRVRGRRETAIELRVDAWSRTESRLRLAPARRGMRRALPDASFYAAAHEALVMLRDELLLLVVRGDLAAPVHGPHPTPALQPA